MEIQIKFRWLFIVLLLFAMNWPKPLWAAPPPETMEQKLIRLNIAISEWLDGAAEVIDVFLVGEKVTNRENETSVRIENSTLSTEGEDISNTTSLGVNLRLPNVEDYFALKFTTYDESQEKRGVQKGLLRKTPRERNYGATVGLFRQLGNVKASFQPRIELQDPLRVAHSMTFESLVDMKTFDILPKFELFANPDRGTGIFNAINFLVPLTEVFSLGIVNSGEYEERSHDLSVANGISIGHTLTDKTSLAYGFVLFSTNRPDYRLNGYTFAITWSHLLYKRILDYNVIPHVDFSADDNYRAVAGLIINFNLNF
jgi:hypothetical protein